MLKLGFHGTSMIKLLNPNKMDEIPPARFGMQSHLFFWFRDKSPHPQPRDYAAISAEGVIRVQRNIIL